VVLQQGTKCPLVLGCAGKTIFPNGLNAFEQPCPKKILERQMDIITSPMAAIDWDLLDQAYMESPTGMRHWATKHASGHFSHSQNMVQWKFCMNLACPRCQETIEDKLYDAQCPGGTEQWKEALNHLQKWLKDQNTDHGIIKALITGLSKWLDNSTNQSIDTTDPLIHAWEEVGWDYVLDGR